MAQFSLRDFKSQVLRKGLARTNRFEISFTPPMSASREVNRRVNLLVESTQFPFLSISTKPLKIYGPSYQMPTTSEYGGEGWTVNFHVDREMTVKTLFDQWMEGIVIGGSLGTFNVNYQNNYTCDITVKQLDENNNTTYAITLFEAFPRYMNVMELSNSSQNETHKLNMTFAYRYWRNVQDKPVQSVPTATTKNPFPKIVLPPVDRNNPFTATKPNSPEPRGSIIRSGDGTPVRSGSGTIVRTDPNR